jgi:hypothetical protein
MIVPALLVITCFDGRGCDEEIYPMPDWPTCLEAPMRSSQTGVPVEMDAQEFHVAITCIGQEVKDEAISFK